MKAQENNSNFLRVKISGATVKIKGKAIMRGFLVQF
jgi:hypothetical protein